MHATKALIVSLFLVGSAAGQSGAPISPRDFERLHRDIRPRRGESRILRRPNLIG
jgi:hypothetical protein